MSGDIALTWGATEGAADFFIEDNDLATSDDLQNAVLISLFLDAPADDYRGWWGDNFATVPGDRIGSRLWTLARAKQVPQTLTDAKQICEEALTWMVDDKVLDRFEVESGFVAFGVMGIGTTLYRPTGEVVRFRYNYAWASQELRAV